MIVPDETFREMLLDVSRLSMDVADLLRNVKPKESADVTRLIGAARGIQERLAKLTHTIIIVTEENTNIKPRQ